MSDDPDAAAPRGRLERLATGRSALLASAVLLAFTAGFRLLLRNVLRVPPIELEWWPRKSGPELLAVLSRFQEWERANHLIALAVDFAYPVVYALGLALPALYLLRRARAGAGVRRLAYVAVAAAAFDVLENACIVALLAGSRSNALAWAVIALSAAKWVLVGAAVFVLLGAAAAAAVSAFGQRGARLTRGTASPRGRRLRGAMNVSPSPSGEDQTETGSRASRAG